MSGCLRRVVEQDAGEVKVFVACNLVAGIGASSRICAYLARSWHGLSANHLQPS